MNGSLRTVWILGCMWLFAAHGFVSAKGPARGALRLQRIDVTLTGKVLSFTPDSLRDGTDALLLLVAPTPAPEGSAPTDPCARRAAEEAATISLLRLQFSPDEGVAIPKLIQDDLPGADGRIVVNDTGDLLVLLPGRLVRVPRDGSPVATLLSDPGLHPRTSEVVSTPKGWLVSIPGMGTVRFVRLKPDGAHEELAAVDVPVQANLGRAAFRLRSEIPSRFLDDDRSSPIWTTPPAGEGRQRLHGVRIEPDADPVRVDWWGRLPDPEEMFGHAELIVAGEPAVMVTTRRADKLGLFGEKRLRMFRMKTDRGHTGHAPFFATETRANLWQEITPNLLDVNGDGDEDLVLGYWKGLIGAKVVLDVYLSDGEGSFAPNPRTTAFDVKRADRSFLSYGHDLDGDGRPDLAIVGDGAFQVYRGTAANPKGKNLVSTRPDGRVRIVAKDAEPVEVEVTVSSGGVDVEGESLESGPIRILDLGGDGRYEAVFTRFEDGRWVLSLIRVGLH